jgi:hypothetical protein
VPLIPDGACNAADDGSLARWLKKVGANPMFGLFGFVLAFDLTYLWGFNWFSTPRG